MELENPFSDYRVDDDYVREIITEINENSFFIVERLLSEEVAAAVLSEVNEMNMGQSHGGNSLRQSRIAVRSPLMRQIMCHPLVLAVWKAYLGNDYCCSTFTSNTILPDDGHINWHVDYPYWGMEQPWLSGRMGGQSLWTLETFTAENGATGAVPGSHKFGCAPEKSNEWRDDGIILEAPAGTLILADGAWYHTSRKNSSTAPRSCLLTMYLKNILEPQEDMLGQLAEIENPTETEQWVMSSKRRLRENV